MKPRPKPESFQRRLFAWYKKHRRNLPWRQTRDPYAIAVSEVMLQQTQVSRVIPKYKAWLKTFPTTASLARAPLSRVLQLWSGLGHNRRARMLRDAARAVVGQYHGHWPKTVEELKKLPGFGPYTASAVAVFAFRQPTVMIDTNVRRVVTRWMIGIKKVSDRDLSVMAANLMPAARPDDWHHALMDFGATVCLSTPHCEDCPFRSVCRAYPAVLTRPKTAQVGKSKFRDTNRFVRGRVVAAMLATRSMSLAKLQRQLMAVYGVEPGRTAQAVHELMAEKTFQRRKSTYLLAP